MTKSNLESVKSFWETEACGTHFVQEAADEKEFYTKYSDYRFKVEWHLPLLVPFESGRNKSVLEIGCGNGADGVQWAKHGARYTDVDLTETAVNATRQHFEILNLPGTFQVKCRVTLV